MNRILMIENILIYHIIQIFPVFDFLKIPHELAKTLDNKILKKNRKQ
jgi:hypothetical protein